MAQEESKFIKYLNNKVQIKEKAPVGDNIAIYIRPGDKIDLEALGINLENARFKLIGGDIVLEMAGAGNYTFVSLALMGYGENTPEFIGVGGKVTSLSAILSNIEEINALPINSVVTNEFVNLPDASEQDKKNKANEEKKNEATPQVIVIDNNIATDDNISQSLAESTAQFIEQSIEESVVNENISMKIKTDKAKATKTEDATEDATEDSKEDSKEDDTEDSKGDASVEGIEPTLSFDINIQHVEIRENTIIDANEKKLFVYGGGGTSYANIYPKGYNSVDKTALVAQTKTETIDYSDKSGSYNHVVIHADDSTLFGITKTSRTIQLTPSQPEGFQITKVTISSADFPEGFIALNGVLSGDTWTIQKDNPLTEKIDGFTISNNGVINITFSITFSVDNTQDSNFVFSLNAISEFNMDNVSESNKDIIIAPIKTLLEFEKDYAVQVKNIENETKDKEYDFKSFSLNGKEYETGFVITTNINDTKTVGAQELVNTIYGGIVNDTIYGGTKNDTIYGYTGDDTIITRAGNYIVDGGVGTDTVDYSYISDTKAINVDLNRATEVVFQIGTPTNYDNLTHIENIIATKNDDLIKGSDDFAVVNTLDGYKGDDVFYSSKGIDSFIGGLGTDTLDFSSVDLLNGGNRVIVDLGLGKITDDGYHNGATAVEDYVSEIEIVIGTTGNDNLYGDSNKNTLVGANGDDIIYGREGDDSLNGGAGADDIDGGTGDDIILGGADADNIDGGTGADTINGEAGADVIVGGYGADNIDGGTGADVIVGGYGDDTLTGGIGIDELSYVSSFSSITVTLGNGSTAFGTITSTSTTEGTDKLLDHFEKIRGSNYSDIFTGFSGTAIALVNYSDTLYGEGDNDTIYGGLGDDSLNGGGGDDTFRGQAGNDIIDGDTGTNTIDFSDATATGVTVYLDGKDGTGATVAYQVMADGFSGQDIVTNVTRVIGSKFKDTLKGTAGDDVLQAGAGDDIIYYTRGLDYYDGGTHTISATGTQGSTAPYLASGDWVSLAKETTTTVDFDLRNTIGTVGANLSTGLARVTNIENIIGYNGVQNTTGWGNTGNNIFVMYGGADIILGGDGSDVYDLGAGNDRAYATESLVASGGSDTLIGGAGIDILDYRNNWGSTVGNIIILTTQNMNGTVYDVDTYTSLITVSGLEIADGEYTFFKVRDGRSGLWDYILQEKTTDIATGAVAGTADFENFLLSAYADIFSGDSDANTVSGNEGNDTIYGQSGNDTIYGGNNSDYIHGGADNDRIYGERDVDILYGNEGNDSIDGGDSNDSVYGGIGNDTLLGGNADDKLYGEDGDDTLYSDGGIDYIDGGTGTDLLLFGGTGTARVVVNLSTSSITYDTTNSLAANRILDSVGHTDTVANLTIENVTGGTGADTFAGSTANNVLNGADGNDYFYSSIGTDNIIGGNGTDTLDFTNLTTTAGVNFTLSSTGSTSLSFSSGGTAYTQTIATMENFTGSSQNDTINGDGVANLIIGGAGDDTIDGKAGNDVINGGAGNDLFTIDFSAIDTIDGGADSDTVKSTSTYSLSADTNFASAGNFTNIETLDISGMTLSSTNDTEYTFNDSTVGSWLGASTTLTLKLKSTQAEFIKFTGNKTGDSPDVGNVSWDNDTVNTISEGSYNLGTKTLTIDFTDVP